MEAKVPVNVLLPISLHESLKQAADANQGSLASEIRRRLVQDVGERAHAGTPAPADGAVEADVAARNGEAS